MTDYLVKWQIDIEAETPDEAARIALEIQRDCGSEALIFEVMEEGTKEPTLVNLLPGGTNLVRILD